MLIFKVVLQCMSQGAQSVSNDTIFCLFPIRTLTFFFLSFIEKFRMDESLALPTAAVGSKLADEESAKDKLLEIQPLYV